MNTDVVCVNSRIPAFHCAGGHYADGKADLPHCGLRKSTNRRLAESGTTPLQGRAVTSHKTGREFACYAESANRRTIADAAHAKLIGEPNLANLEKL